MEIRFTKMEGCGNDYVYIDGISQSIPAVLKPDLARELSDRHFGVGGDGVIFINRSGIADFEMEMFNADGTRGEMCGNGIRCVGKYVYDHGYTDREEITVESFGSVKTLTLFTADSKVQRVRVNMGPAILEADDIPAIISQAETEPVDLPFGRIIKPVIGVPILVGKENFPVTCVSMGNPHAVVYVDDTEEMDLTKIGPKFEHHPRFPRRINTEFVEIIDYNHVRMRVWERGSGETLACGTGCCAVCVAGVLSGRTADRVLVDVRGGQLEIHWDQEKNVVWMTGPATEVFEGTVRRG